jgi:plasmid stabilization system protein ParE
MAEIRWTEQAADWFNNIYDFIYEENPTAASKVVNQIYEKVAQWIFPGGKRQKLYSKFLTLVAWKIKTNKPYYLIIFNTAFKGL